MMRSSRTLPESLPLSLSLKHTHTHACVLRRIFQEWGGVLFVFVSENFDSRRKLIQLLEFMPENRNTDRPISEFLTFKFMFYHYC